LVHVETWTVKRSVVGACFVLLSRAMIVTGPGAELQTRTLATMWGPLWRSPRIVSVGGRRPAGAVAVGGAVVVVVPVPGVVVVAVGVVGWPMLFWPGGGGTLPVVFE
jgi:hypothetical protein